MSDEQYVWEPVEDGKYRVPGGTLIVYDGMVGMGTGIGKRNIYAGQLPADWGVCRRVPAQGQGVPVGAIRKLIAFVDEWGSIGDTEGMPNLWIEVAEARTWLDRITTAEQHAQPQTGQGVE